MSEDISSQESEAVNVESDSFDFKSHISEEYRDNPVIKDYKDINGLVKSHISAQQMLGSSIRIPTEEASEDQWNQFYQKLQTVPGVTRLPDLDNKEASNDFYQKLGRPETFDKYQINLPENAQVDQNNYDDFLKVAFDLGLTNKQANSLVKFELGRQAQQAEAYKQSYEDAKSVLEKKWGHDFDNRLAGAKLARDALKEEFPSDMEALLSSAGNNAALTALFSKLGEALQEKGHIAGDQVKYGMTPDEAKLRISEIRGNASHPYYHASDPAHDAALKKVEKLYKVAFPENG